jgi:hypothetical protein
MAPMATLTTTNSGQTLGWLIAGTLAWFVVHSVFPKAAGYILAAIVIGAIIMLGPQLATIGRTGASGGW